MRTPLSLAAIATTAMPDINIVATQDPQYANEKYQATGLLDSNGQTWMLTAPLTAQAAHELINEVKFTQQLLPIIARQELPFTVLQGRSWAPLPEGWNALLHDVLPGRPLTEEELLNNTQINVELGKTLAKWHEIPTWTVESAGLPIDDGQSILAKIVEQVDRARQTGILPTNLLNRWDEFCSNTRWWDFTPTVVHGDFNESALQVENGEIVAVTNLHAVQISDPAIDLAWVTAAAPFDSVETIFSAYEIARTTPVDKYIRKRAQFHSEIIIVRWFLHGLEQQDKQIQQEALEMLNELALEIANEEEEKALLALEVATINPTDEMTGEEIEAALAEEAYLDQPNYVDNNDTPQILVDDYLQTANPQSNEANQYPNSTK